MKILAIDSSAGPVSAAVIGDGVLMASAYGNTHLTHSQTLLPMVEDMLKNGALTLEDMEALAVSVGPGSFTGVRIGVAAVKGLAFSLNKPCAAVSTLEAMAENVTAFEGMVICAMDARRQQIYNAVFDCHGGRLIRRCEDRAIALEVLAQELARETCEKIVVGDGAGLCHTYLLAQGISCRMAPAGSLYQRASGVGLAAQRMVEQGRTVTPQALRPVYLRLSQAERERLAKGLPITVE